MLKIALIGSGHLGSAICKLYRSYHADNFFELKVLTTSKKKIGQTLYGLAMQEFNPSLLAIVDIVILAIPADLTLGFAQTWKDALRGKTVVDCSNKLANGVELTNLLQAYNCSVIKAFTSINVFHILDNRFSIAEGPRDLIIAGNDKDALASFAKVTERLGYTTRFIPNIAASNELEAVNLKNFSKWQQPLIVTGLTWSFFTVYAIFDRNIAYGKPWYAQSIQTLNAAVCSTAITLFSLVYGTGAVALIKQNVLGRILSPIDDSYLVNTLNRRKQQGLIASWLLTMHATISTLLFGSTYYPYFTEEQDGVTTLSNTAMLSLGSGVIGFCLYLLLATTSLPSVAKNLGMVEWRTVQSYGGWSALLFSIAHVLVMGYEDLITTTNSGVKMPSLFMMASLLPMLTILAKVLSWITSFNINNKFTASILPTHVNTADSGNNLPEIGFFSSNMPGIQSSLQEDYHDIDQEQDQETNSKKPLLSKTRHYS